MRRLGTMLCAALLTCAACGRSGDADADRGVELGRAGDLAAAAAAFERALAADPEQPKALFNLGLVRQAEGESSEAERLFARFVAMRPDDAPARLEHARALAALGRTPEALAELRDSVRLGLSDHAALASPEFEPLRSDVSFVALDVTVAQRAGAKPLTRTQDEPDGRIGAPPARIVPPGSQDTSCDPLGASTMEPADPVERQGSRSSGAIGDSGSASISNLASR